MNQVKKTTFTVLAIFWLIGLALLSATKLQETRQDGDYCGYLTPIETYEYTFGNCPQ